MDLITLTQAKNYANKVAAGFSNVAVDGMNINFTLNDGSKATVVVPIPENGTDGISVVNLSIDTDGSLLCHMSDGSTIDAGHVPTVDPDLTNYYTKDEIQDKFSSFKKSEIDWDCIQKKPFGKIYGEKRDCGYLIGSETTSEEIDFTFGFGGDATTEIYYTLPEEKTSAIKTASTGTLFTFYYTIGDRHYSDAYEKKDNGELKLIEILSGDDPDGSVVPVFPRIQYNDKSSAYEL